MATTVKHLTDNELRDNLSLARSESRRRTKEQKASAVKSCNQDLLVNLARSIVLLCPHPSNQILTEGRGKQTCLCCKQRRYQVEGEWRQWKL